MNIKYVGNENGIFVRGRQFSRNINVEIDEGVALSLKEKYPSEFILDDAEPEEVSSPKDSGIAEQELAEELGLLNEDCECGECDACLEKQESEQVKQEDESKGKSKGKRKKSKK